MLQRPEFIPIPISMHMSILFIPWDPESHILSPWGSHQSPETTQNTPDTVAFLIALYQMVKTCCGSLNWYPYPTPPHESISPIPSDAGSHILGPWGTNLSPETTQNTSNTVTFLLRGTGWLKSYCCHQNSCLYPLDPLDYFTHPKGTFSHSSGAPAAPFRAQNQPKILSELPNFP